MLHEFLVEQRENILSLARKNVAFRATPTSSAAESVRGLGTFLDQIDDALRLAQSTDSVDHRALEGSAHEQANRLLREGLSIAQVVHAYGTICQAITHLAIEHSVSIAAKDFRVLNLCLDDAIAEAVTTYSRRRESEKREAGAELLTSFAVELRTLVESAMLSFEMIRTGSAAPAGSTGLVHSQTLVRIGDLIHHSLTRVRLDAAARREEHISVAELIEEIELGAGLRGSGRGVAFVAPYVDPNLRVRGDRQMLLAALSSLLENAFRFTHEQSRVRLTARAAGDRVLFEVEDECGGLPTGLQERLSEAFVHVQMSGPETPLGAGLALCLHVADGIRATLGVRDLPGVGCVFTLDLPRADPSRLADLEGRNDAGTKPS